MTGLDKFAAVVVALAGLYCLWIAGVAFMRPSQAARFFGGFVGDARVHYLELALRALTGGSMIVYAPHMKFSTAIGVFGWMLAISSVILGVLPWRWHQAFARRTVPVAMQYPKLLGVGAAAIGLAIVAAMLGGTGVRG